MRKDNILVNGERVSLRQLLAFGRLDGLKAGMTKAEVEELLGPPDGTGGTLSDGRPPSIYVYGDMEIFFREDDRNRAVSVFFESLTGGEGFRLPARWIVNDWELRPRQSAEEVRCYLEASAIAYQVSEPTPGLTLRFRTESAGAEIVFDDDGLLDSIGAGLPG